MAEIQSFSSLPSSLFLFLMRTPCCSFTYSLLSLLFPFYHVFSHSFIAFCLVITPPSPALIPNTAPPYLYLCLPNLADIKSDPLRLSLPQTIACKSDRTEAREATIQGPWSFKIRKLQKIARDEMKLSLRARREVLSIYREENCLLLMNCEIVRQDWQD